MSASERRCGTLIPQKDEEERMMDRFIVMNDIADYFQPFVSGMIRMKHPEFTEDELDKASVTDTGFLVHFWLGKLEPYRCALGGVSLPELDANLLPLGCEIDFDEFDSFESLGMQDVLDMLGVVGTGSNRNAVVTAAISYLTM